jgi:hypothetical protein
VRAQVTEIGEHPIAHVLGDKTVEASGRLRNAPVVGADYGP